MTDDGAGVLSPLGVGEDEENVYRALLAQPASTVAELRARLGLGEHRLRRCLAELERKAIVTRRAGVPSRFQPVPPDIVVDALISTREDELSQVRLRAHELTTLLRQPAEQLQTADLVEVLATREAAAERFAQLQRVTRERLEAMVRPPWGRLAMGDDEESQRSLLARGVVVMGIYDEDALRQPGILDHLQRMAARGEQARVVNRLPLKLALFDRRVALVPLTRLEPTGRVDAGLVVHRSALLDALIALFDLYWRRGAPIPQEHPAPPADPAAGEDEILTLLAAGLKDAAIAHRLGVSTSTVRRRITALLERLGATTRFQAGLALSRLPEQRPAPR